MNREELIEICNRKVKFVRTEFSFSQEKMAVVLGISKKTLVEIEKGRSSLGWTGSVAFCTIFEDSQTLIETFQGRVKQIILDNAFEGCDQKMQASLGLGIWWHVVRESEKHIIYQNVISQHYRLVSKDGVVMGSSFELEELEKMIK